MTCCIKGCDRAVLAKQLCAAHYRRARLGRPLTAPIQKQVHGATLGERLAQHYATNPDTGCWEWTASTNNGYGQLRVGSRSLLAHRIAYQLYVGDPTGGVVCHRCDNPKCVNPDHLFLGEQADNMADMIAKGRALKRGLKGEAHPASKLTAADVQAIRRSPLSDTAAAEHWGVSRGAVHDIRKRRSWAHVI